MSHLLLSADTIPTSPTEVLLEIRDMIDEELDRRDACEHGVIMGFWCGLCNREHIRSHQACEAKL